MVRCESCGKQHVPTRNGLCPTAVLRQPDVSLEVEAEWLPRRPTLLLSSSS